MRKPIWHYTTYLHAVQICDDGRIKPTRQDGGQDAVWFSDAPLWEPTASKAALDQTGKYRTGDCQDTFRSGCGFVRLRISPNVKLLSWREYKRLTDMPSTIANEFERDGRELGADPINWFCSFDPVARDNWLSIEEISDPADLAAFRWKKSARFS
jgi:hypothetical protein